MRVKDTIGVREAARQIGCTLKYIYDLLYSGRLPGEKVGRTWRIRAKEVAARLKAKGANDATARR